MKTEMKMNRLRYLTKGTLKQALECPTKLYYLKNKLKYADQGVKAFVSADVGYRIGEMAKLLYTKFPNAITIESMDDEAALAETHRLLTSNENVVIAEGAVRHENLFIRADILVKTGDSLKLVEVKSKGIDSVKGRESFLNSKNVPQAKWKSTLYDVAFQTYVLQKAYPYKVYPHLLLLDKDETAELTGIAWAIMQALQLFALGLPIQKKH